MADYVYGISMPAHAREIINRNSSLQSILTDTVKVFFDTNPEPRQPIRSAIRELIVVIKLSEDKLIVFCLWLSRIAGPRSSQPTESGQLSLYLLFSILSTTQFDQ